MTDIQTLRVLKRLVDEGGTLPLWKITQRVMAQLKKRERRKVLSQMVDDGLIVQNEIRRVNGAGPPGQQYVLTPKGKKFYADNFLADAMVVRRNGK